MPSSTKPVSTAVDSWPLPATEDDKIDKVRPAAGQGARQAASNSRTALGKKAVDHQDSRNRDNHGPAGTKEVRVQAETHDSRHKPQGTATGAVNTSLPAAVPTTITYTASTDHDTGNKRENNKKNKKKYKNTSKNHKSDVETDDGDGDGAAGDQSNSCLPSRHRGDPHGPRKGDKVGWFQKVRLPDCPRQAIHIGQVIMDPLDATEMLSVSNNPSGKGHPSNFCVFCLQST